MIDRKEIRVRASCEHGPMCWECWDKHRARIDELRAEVERLRTELLAMESDRNHFQRLAGEFRAEVVALKYSLDERENERTSPEGAATPRGS